MIYSICYVSTCDPTLEQDDVKALFKQTESANNKANIGGILLYSEGNFFQILECDSNHKDVIINLFDKIKDDSRHYDVMKIFEKTTPSRSFSKYHSDFKAIENPANIKELYNFLKLEKQNNPEGYSQIAYLAQKFLTLI